VSQTETATDDCRQVLTLVLNIYIIVVAISSSIVFITTTP